MTTSVTAGGVGAYVLNSETEVGASRSSTAASHPVPVVRYRWLPPSPLIVEPVDASSWDYLAALFREAAEEDRSLAREGVGSWECLLADEDAPE